jgi:hypothetical protein
MGWIYIHRKAGLTNLEVFTAEYGVIHVVDLATTSLHEAYMAYKRDDGLVMGVVLFTNYRPRWEQFNFGWQDMDEGMGPCAYNCPDRILALLSPVDLLYPDNSVLQGLAAIWRSKCREGR